ncbi:Protein FAR1-RELATED SEQUENCE 12 [Linum grandiflorum]
MESGYYCGGKLDDFEDEWSLEASASNLEADWGYVFGSLPKDKKAKRRRKENCGSSSNGCSTTCTSDLSEALSSISAALSLSSSDSDHRDGDTNGRTVKRGQDEEMLDWLTSTASIPNSEDGDADGKMISFSDGYSQDHAAFEICGRTEQEKIQAVPQIGMEFFSKEEAYLFYKSYAEASGFRVRKGKVQRATDGTIRKRYIFCSRQGFRSRYQLTKETKYKRKETRTGCNAQICCTAEEGKWVLTHCSLEHNHELLNQHMTMTRSSDGQEGTSIQQGSDINARNIQREDSHSLQKWIYIQDELSLSWRGFNFGDNIQNRQTWQNFYAALGSQLSVAVFWGVVRLCFTG